MKFPVVADTFPFKPTREKLLLYYLYIYFNANAWQYTNNLTQLLMREFNYVI